MIYCKCGKYDGGGQVTVQSGIEHKGNAVCEVHNAERCVRYEQVCRDIAPSASRVAAINYVPSVDELAEALAPHWAEIVEVGTWNPLAKHVQGIIQGVLKGFGVKGF